MQELVQRKVFDGRTNDIKEEKEKQKVIFMKINLLLEHSGMIQFLEFLVDKKCNWQILLPN